MKKIPVYSSISQCLFKYYTGKWLKFEILQYNQVPIQGVIQREIADGGNRRRPIFQKTFVGGL